MHNTIHIGQSSKAGYYWFSRTGHFRSMKIHTE